MWSERLTLCSRVSWLPFNDDLLHFGRFLTISTTVSKGDDEVNWSCLKSAKSLAVGRQILHFFTDSWEMDLSTIFQILTQTSGGKSVEIIG